jgi:hypothetical protein
MATVITMTGPGTTTVALDPVAAAIATANLATVKQLTAIQAACVEINKAVLELKNNTGVSAKALSDLQIAVASVATATASQTVIQAAAASNQIKTNNFQVQATKDALIATGQPVPQEPPIVEQLTTTIKDSLTMNGAAQAQGAITNFVTTQSAAIATWILTTETYKDITTYLKKAKDTIVASIFPPTAKDVKSSTQAVAGIPTPD